MDLTDHIHSRAIPFKMYGREEDRPRALDRFNGIALKNWSEIDFNPDPNYPCYMFFIRGVTDLNKKISVTNGSYYSFQIQFSFSSVRTKAKMCNMLQSDLPNPPLLDPPKW